MAEPLKDMFFTRASIEAMAGNPKFAEVLQEMEMRIKGWLAQTEDRFETGRREPKKGVLDMDFTLQRRWSKGGLQRH